jgi:sugar/nucleoside kinase (ribokinase family)
LDTLVSPFEDLRWGTTTYVETINTRIGGSAANTARALAILGVPVRVSAFVGADEAGDAILRDLNRCGVDVSSVVTLDESTPQTVALVSNSGERQFLHRKGCSEVAFSNGLNFTPELVCRVSHFHLASLFVVPHLRQYAPLMLRQARTAGLTTSLDTCWDPLSEWMQVLRPCLPHLDILFLNEDEAAEFGMGESAADLKRASLSMGPGMIVIKKSSEGCRIYRQTEEIVCPAYDVEPRDSTGAGDCFVGGFLAGHLEGSPPLTAGLMGNAAGALSVQSIGAVEGLLPRIEMERWMARTRLRTG